MRDMWNCLTGDDDADDADDREYNSGDDQEVPDGMTRADESQGQ